MVAYALIGVAVVAEVFGDSMMKLSNGFQRKLPLVGTVLGYGIAFYLIALTLEHLPLGPVYAAWTGLGIALTAIVGAVVWKEGFNVKKALAGRHHRRRCRAGSWGVNHAVCSSGRFDRYRGFRDDHA
ncbi:MAG: DMT family transporter [Slackia sp.]